MYFAEVARFNEVSIHAPAKGATMINGSMHQLHWVSIHAPAKGATMGYNVRYVQQLFQSTLPRRERPVTGTDCICFTCFNPRSREGSDVKRRKNQIIIILSFNPRSREGSDECMYVDYDYYDVSIHAPAKGATTCNDQTFCVVMFQSTLPRRERHRSRSR